MSGYYWDGDYEPPSSPAPPHLGPVADDYTEIGRRLKLLEDERSRRVQAQPLPEVTPVPASKPLWT